jgi:hypothetical protein
MNGREPIQGEFLRKIQPKLRMIANGSMEVNMVRADFTSSLRVSEKVVLRDVSPTSSLPRILGKGKPEKGKLKKVPSQIEASVFVVKTAESDFPSKGAADKNKRFSYRFLKDDFFDLDL